MTDACPRALVWLAVAVSVGGCGSGTVARDRDTICHPPAIDDRGRVGWSDSFLAGGENGSETLTYDEHNLIATRTIQVDDALTIAPCLARWAMGPPPCAFASGAFQVVEYEDRYTYNERRQPIAKVRTTWLIGPFSIHQRPDPDGPRTRASVGWVRWWWPENQPTAVEAGSEGKGGEVLQMSPETYRLLQEAKRIFTLVSYDAANRPIGEAPLPQVTPLPGSCVEKPTPPGLGWGTIEVNRGAGSSASRCPRSPTRSWCSTTATASHGARRGSGRTPVGRRSGG